VLSEADLTSEPIERRPRRARAVVIALLVVVAGGGTAVTLANGGSRRAAGSAPPAVPAVAKLPVPSTMPADPVERLAAMRAFVAAAKSVHVDVTYGWSMPVEGLPEPLKQETNMRGDVLFPTHVRLIGQDLSYQEVMTTPEGLFYRKASTEAGLATASWTRHPLSVEQYRDTRKEEVLPGSSADASALGFDLRKLPEVLDGLAAPEATSDGVKGRYRPDQSGDVITTIELSMNPGVTGLQRMAWTLDRPVDPRDAEAGRMTVSADVTFFDWNEPVDIRTPASAALPDDTPGIDEAAIAAYDEVPLFGPAPATLPSGFRLVTAEVQDRLERGGCPEVLLHYEDPAARAVRTDGGLSTELELTIGREECRTDLDGEADNQPYTAGPYRGTFEQPDPSVRRGQNYDYTTVHLSIEGAAVEVSSNLPDDAIRAAVAGLRPFVLAEQPIYHRPTSG
jgi:hypothetical protein